MESELFFGICATPHPSVKTRKFLFYAHIFLKSIMIVVSFAIARQDPREQHDEFE
jgi:hypothetical protein